VDILGSEADTAPVGTLVGMRFPVEERNPDATVILRGWPADILHPVAVTGIL
jgi:hypothetical protein